MAENFHPLRGASNPHLQTLLPRLVRRHVKLKPVWQRLELPDGDFLDLAWSENPEFAQQKPRMVLFHGLEGSFTSPYAHGLLQAWKDQGGLGVVMHFRGCSGEPNRLQRIYHSGETSDARFFLRWLNETYGDVPTAAVGFSLGGNMLACYLGQEGADCRLTAAVIVSAPLMLEPCARRLEQGSSRIYQHYLLDQLKANARRKLIKYPGTLPVTLGQLKSMRRIREFDEAITSKAHGFQNALDYYRRCSGMPLLARVKVPLLIIHAKDDPFMTDAVIPNIQDLPPEVEYQLTEHGGHVGFVAGSWLNPVMWLEQRIPEWLAPRLACESTIEKRK
ncbi:hydrolase [Rouxiella sp. S1S-2]|uniref:hydrolase n=1 Tax=Rouxiella sp. S1S-2 TaxID=2653856 RepID=UPI00126572D9|nr:hydrolase [Rouxiella sp. S1S-2]KAB7894983.1 hydrolase [Rouxiella sp. S1S-2]